MHRPSYFHSSFLCTHSLWTRSANSVNLSIFLDRPSPGLHCSYSWLESRFIGTACAVYAAGSTQRSGFRLSFRLSRHSLAARRCCGFSAERPTGGRYRLIAGACGRCTVQQAPVLSSSGAAARRSAANEGQCRVDSWRTKLDADLFFCLSRQTCLDVNGVFTADLGNFQWAATRCSGMWICWWILPSTNPR